LATIVASTGTIRVARNAKKITRLKGKSMKAKA
jgi:hypothetical protein